jgi:hypothetical protein
MDPAVVETTLRQADVAWLIIGIVWRQFHGADPMLSRRRIVSLHPGKIDLPHARPEECRLDWAVQ